MQLQQLSTREISSLTESDQSNRVMSGSILRRLIIIVCVYCSYRFGCSRKLIMSARPHGTTHLPLVHFQRNFMLGVFTKLCRQNSNLVKIGQKYEIRSVRHTYVYVTVVHNGEILFFSLSYELKLKKLLKQ